METACQMGLFRFGGCDARVDGFVRLEIKGDFLFFAFVRQDRSDE
jgi:hypothetical protein